MTGEESAVGDDQDGTRKIVFNPTGEQIEELQKHGLLGEDPSKSEIRSAICKGIAIILKQRKEAEASA